MNSSQHRCTNQTTASEAQAQQCSLNSSLGDTFGSPLVHFGVSCSTVARLSARTHLRNRRSPLSSMARGAPHFATSLILNSPILPCTVHFYHGGTRTVHKLSRFEMLPPLARKPMIMPFGRRINRFVSALRQRLKCFPKPSHTLYIRSTVLCCHLPSVIGYLTLKWKEKDEDINIKDTVKTAKISHNERLKAIHTVLQCFEHQCASVMKLLFLLRDEAAKCRLQSRR
ncbi:hypothetical protein TNCV_3341781 [Trichonephila clavipes]|nr:hypothetical protein TNCV_3341781 [Trichonephila clavipes]